MRALVSRLLLAALVACALLPACRRAESPGPDASGEAPEDLVSGHTRGLISRRAAIRLELVPAVATPEQVGKAVAGEPLWFDPPIRGQATWTGPSSIEFRPAADLPGGQAYRATVDLPRIVPGHPSARAFSFRFGVLAQSFWTEGIGLEADGEDGAVQRYRGTLHTADDADADAVVRALVAEHGDDPLTVEWDPAADQRAHRFAVRGIRRQERGTTLTLKFDGGSLGVDREAEETVQVPGLNQFVVTSVRAEIRGDRHVEVRFSDPLQADQDLSGLVRVLGREDLRLQRDGSVVRIYATAPWGERERVEVSGVKNARGFTLLDPFAGEVTFSPLKPGVRFAGSGVILPSTADLKVPVEVTNLKAVLVEAMALPADNLPQFLQVNGLAGQAELHRVGRVVWRDRVEVEAGPERYNRPVRLGLDLSPLVRAHPAGLYRISVRFQRRDIVWDCAAPAWEESDEPEDFDWEKGPRERSFWDSWADEDAEGESAWDHWERRDDPCTRGYYFAFDEHDITATRNLVISDLGLVAKRGQDRDLLVVATDLGRAEPVAGAAVSLVDYQLQEMATGTTASDGTARLKLPADRPFLIAARWGQQRAWLRLDLGSALAVSHLDVAGAEVTRGLKGFLYGERGVWRPGDPIHLNFVLHDATGALPARHPLDFEVQDPRGQRVEQRTVTESLDGFYRLDTRTAPDAPTGNYTARVRVGGATFEKVLRVDTVKPNRLKVSLTPGAAPVRAPDLAFDGQLASQWLHGASAHGLRADVELRLSPRPTRFPRYADFTFDDPLAQFRAEPVRLWEGSLDAQGKAKVAAAVPVPGGAPGFLTGTLQARVFEPGGAFSVEQQEVPISPHYRYLGIQLPPGDKERGMLLTDKPHTARIVAVDADGKPAGDGEIEVALYKVRWRWWWEKGQDDLAEYVTSEGHTPLKVGKVPLKGGVASWEFQVNYPDWGRYVVVAWEPDGGHRTGRIVYIDWPGWAGRAGKERPGGASVLSLSVDRPEVARGEDATLSFPLPQGARALVSLETGTRVLQTAWVAPPAQGPTARYTFTATADMAPGVYAHVTVIQPHRNTANDAPIRLYGIVPVGVRDPATRLVPELTTAATFSPEATAMVSVREAAGREMTYTLAVVDEGLLGLTRFATPDPWGVFYAREALGVRTWDLYDQVAGAFGGAVEGLLTVGGDGDGAAARQPRAQRFPPMVWTAGPWSLRAGDTASHKVPIPKYVGAVRVMVVAGHRGAYGAAEKSVVVKKPLMVLATLPRVVGPDERVDLPVSVFSLAPGEKDVTVTAAVSGPGRIEGPAERKVHFAAPGDALTPFRVQVGGGLGVMKVKVTAAGGGQTATDSLEIDVRHPGTPVTRVVSAEVEPGKSWDPTLTFSGPAAGRTASLELSRIPPLHLDTRLESLLGYPHGCAEQTISKAFPQVYLPGLVELGPEDADRAQAAVRAGVDRLKQFQAPSGGIGLWPGDPPSDWLTSWGGQFLLEAQRVGHVVPPSMRAAWVAWQRDRANRWVSGPAHGDLEQAYRLYTLAAAGAPDLGAMNRLKELGPSAQARWRLAAAFAWVGQGAVAEALVKGAPTEVAPYRELSGTFGSDLRDEAMVLESLVLLGRRAEADRLAARVSAGLGRDGELPTQSAAFALVALARSAGVGTGPWSYALGQGGAAPGVRTASRPIVRLPLAVAKGDSFPVRIENRAAGRIHARVVMRGLAAAGSEVAESAGLALSVRYLDLQGAPRDPASVPHGDDLIAEVTVDNLGDRRLPELVLSQVLPSGWEISGLSGGRGSGFDYRDVRDDRVYTYFDLAPKGSAVFRVPVNASYSGRFYLPPVAVEAMYDPSLRARVPGRWIEVTPEPGV